MNPHLKEQGLKEANNLANLITPDLWLKNCRSRSASPASTMSLSPGPHSASIGVERTTPTMPVSPPKTNASNTAQQTSNASYKPMISVAPVSKLMSKSPGIMTSKQSPKHNRKKRPLRSCAPAEMTVNTRLEGKGACAPNPAGIKPKPLLAPLSDNSRTNLQQASGAALTQFAASCGQDLHMNVPPLSPMMDGQNSLPSTPHSLPPSGGRVGSTIPPAFFATPTNGVGVQQPTPPPVAAPTGFPSRPPPFMHNPGGFMPRFMGNFAGMPQPPNSMMPPELAAFNAFVGTPPPVTVMVPYPVIIPLPIPIPVPLPIVDFYKAYLTPEERRKFEDQQNIKKENEMPSANRTTNSSEKSRFNMQAEEEEDEEMAEEPLDFTKTKEMEDCTNEEPAATQTIEDESCQMTNSTATTPSDDTHSSTSPKTTMTTLHCVISNVDNLRVNAAADTNKLTTSLATTQTNDAKNEEDSNTEENNQKLPKLKITRLQTKRTLIQTKESECSRPLRKRKRIIDCDFQKIAAANSKEALENDDELLQHQQQQETTELEISKAQSNK